MPELPEVATFQTYFEAAVLKQPILEVDVWDDKIIRNIDGEAFAQRLKGRTFVDSYRRGKYLFGILDQQHSVLFHFGMTGDFLFYGEGEEAPKYERFVFHFPHGKLGFDCPRKFARILLLESHEAYLNAQQLGPDALAISLEEFLAATKNKKTTIKGWMLNQHHIAGIGNLYADEICFQARVHPASIVSEIPTTKLTTIFQKMKTILAEAVEKKPYYKSYPDQWFWQWRKEGHPAPNGKGSVKKMKVAGRTTYFCSNWQKKYS